MQPRDNSTCIPNNTNKINMSQPTVRVHVYPKSKFYLMENIFWQVLEDHGFFFCVKMEKLLKM